MTEQQTEQHEDVLDDAVENEAAVGDDAVETIGGAAYEAADNAADATAAEASDGPPQLFGQALQRAVEATVFAAEAPMNARQIAAHIGQGVTPGAVQQALRDSAARHDGQGIELVERAGNWHFQTAADLAHLLRREQDEPRRLSRAATEVLAIIAYHQPVSRAEIEAIRGVQTGKGTLDVLLETGWIAPAGRREVPGRPLIYATTDAFMTHFGLSSRRDLPSIDDLRAAGLLEPVDLAFEAAMADAPVDEEELVKDGELP